MAQILSLFGDEAPQPAFERFWEAYPRRKGDNPKKAAKQAWDRLMKAGRDPDRIVRACEAWAPTAESGTPYVPHASTWLNQERFNDILEERERDQRRRVDRSHARKQSMAACIRRCKAHGTRLPRHISQHDVLRLEQEGYL